MITDADVLAAVAAHESDARDAMEFVHGHPELAHEELRCARFLTDQLMRKGVDVELGVGGMDTAFTATVTGTRPGRSVGIVCLYDAVQTIRPGGAVEAVHSCGHGVIAGSVVATALALSDLRSQLAGSLVIVSGTRSTSRSTRTPSSSTPSRWHRAGCAASACGSTARAR
jgi:metal-dependent amidase/aminoacylase/carboxypeptidase family protein